MIRTRSQMENKPHEKVFQEGRTTKRAHRLTSLRTWGICTRRAGKLCKARSRLYRNQILQVNTRWKALAEIYTMHAFAPFSDIEIFVFRKFAIFSQMLLFFRQIDDFSPQILPKVAGISRNPKSFPEFNEFHFRISLL